MYIACEKCKYNYDGECNFYYMGSGNEIDMPCYREKELIKRAADSFLQAFVGSERGGSGMTRFSSFTDDELDAMEETFCNEGLKYLVAEIRRERRYREQIRQERNNKE